MHDSLHEVSQHQCSLPTPDYVLVVTNIHGLHSPVMYNQNWEGKKSSHFIHSLEDNSLLYRSLYCIEHVYCLDCLASSKLFQLGKSAARHTESAFSSCTGYNFNRNM